MMPSRWRILCVSLLGAGCVAIALWADVWFGLAALGLILIKSVVVSRGRLVGRRRTEGWAQAGVWICSLGVLAAFLKTRDGTLRVDQYYSAFAFLLAAILLAPDNRGALPPVGWRCLAMAWAYSGVGVWLTVSYSQNVPRMFYGGLLAALLLLVTCHWLFQLPSM